jgi:predicted acylesterase/phospholipase RssA
MSDTLFFVYAVGILVVWWLRRQVNRKLTKLKDKEEARKLDYQARAFVDPVQMAPYWLMIEFLLLGVGATILYLGITLRVWWPALITALVTYAVFALLLHQVLFVHLFQFGFTTFIKPEMNEARLFSSRIISVFTLWGDLVLSVIIYLPAWLFLYRANAGIVAYFAVGFLPLFTVQVIHHMSAIALRTPRPPWISLGTALVFTPFLSAWLAGSLVWWLKSSERSLVETAKTTTSEQRKSGCEPTLKRWEAGGHRIHVAVSLSGGGYRAALAHAGLLAALDDQCVPIDYLTTVSGGSIIGAAYALGIPPSAFVERLRVSRPGLPNDLLSFSGVMREWIVPWSSNTEVYSDHFRNNFFDNRTLADLPETPRLLVNATDVESGSYESREVFFKGRAPALNVEQGQTLDQTTYIADIVAASGAFPGAFQPMRLRWVSDDSATALKERKFIDGGVVENLGVEGLRRYLTMGSPLPDRPEVLIISDASQYSAGTEFKRKAELVRLLARSQNLSYTALHRQLYARYTGRIDFWTWSREEPFYSQVSKVRYDAIDPRFTDGAPQDLVTVVIPLTAPAPTQALVALSGCEFEPGQPLSAVQQQVSAFDTLSELERKEAEPAYWLGYNLGVLYASAIECARLRVIDPSHTCTASAGATTCRSLADILAKK